MYQCHSIIMLNNPERGPGRRSCITGRTITSVQKDCGEISVYAGCVCLFYDLFVALEDNGLLDSSSEKDLYALHYIFLSRINSQLSVFRNTYAHHRLHTAGNQSPFQLWTKGVLKGCDDIEAINGVLNPVCCNQKCNNYYCKSYMNAVFYCRTHMELIGMDHHRT